MDVALLAGGTFAVAVFVIAEKADAIVDRLSGSDDDPLTDFDATFEDAASEDDDDESAEANEA